MVLVTKIKMSFPVYTELAKRGLMTVNLRDVLSQSRYTFHQNPCGKILICGKVNLAQ